MSLPLLKRFKASLKSKRQFGDKYPENDKMSFTSEDLLDIKRISGYNAIGARTKVRLSFVWGSQVEIYMTKLSIPETIECIEFLNNSHKHRQKE
jgi:hypothetical protein